MYKIKKINCISLFLLRLQILQIIVYNFNDYNCIIIIHLISRNVGILVCTYKIN